MEIPQFGGFSILRHLASGIRLESATSGRFPLLRSPRREGALRVDGQLIDALAKQSLL
jgi:hypothetical protein